jgi:hypothetical protein
MSEIEYLGDALRKQLHALVADLDPSAGLMARIDAIPTAPQPRRWRTWLRRRRIAFAVPVPAGLAAAAAVYALSGGASVANPITVLPNGAVRVTYAELPNIAATNAMLRRRHATKFVIVPLTPSCRIWDVSYHAGTAGPQVAIRLSPHQVAAHTTVAIGTRRLANGDVETAFGRFQTGHVPTCMSSHGWGEGMASDGPLNPPKSK